MSQYFSRALFFALLLPAALPFIFVDGLLYPYLAPKTLLLRADALFVLALLCALAFSQYPFYYARLKNIASCIPAVLLGIAYASSLLGIDFYHSFWSTFDRGDGLLTLSSLAVLFYALLLYADRNFFRKLLQVITVVASLVAGYALLQWVQSFGIDLPLVVEPRGRIGSTMGNAAYLASYLSITSVITLALVWMRTRFHPSLYYALAILQLFAVLITATRGALIALLCAGFLTLIYFAWYGQGKTRRVSQGSLLALMVFVVAFALFRSYLVSIPFTPIARLASISLTEGTVSSRLFLWQELLPLALENPILGTGAEHIEPLFNRIYDPSKIVEQWFDRSHNSFLDYFIQYGFLGLFAYLALIGCWLFYAWKLLREGVVSAGPVLLAGVVYAVQDFFVFDSAVMFFLVFVLFAYVLALSTKEDTPESAKQLLPWKSAGVGLALVALVLMWWVAVLPLRANLYLAEGYVKHVAQVTEANEAFRKGLALQTYADLEYGYQAYVMYTDRQYTMLLGSERVAAYEYARGLLRENLEKYPYDARTATYYGHVLDLTPPEVTRDEKESERVLLHAIELSPMRTQPWFMLANIYLRRADALPPGSERTKLYRAGMEVIERYAAVVPAKAEPHFILASLSLTIGEKGAAEEHAKKGEELYAFDADAAKRASTYYVRVGDWVRAERFLGDLYTAEHAVETLYDYAKAAFLAGKKDEALAAAREVERANKTLYNTDKPFVAAITAYEQSLK